MKLLFPVVMEGCEPGTTKNGELQKSDDFELWCWRRFLGAPCTARKSNLSILKEFSPEYSLEGMMLELKYLYFGPLMRTANSLARLMLGKIVGRRKRGQQRIKWLNGITDSMDVSLSKFMKMVKDRETCRDAVHGVTKSQKCLSN